MAQNNLMERTDALVKEYGRKWKAIAETLRSEGFAQDDGSPLTADTLRQRYKKWISQLEASPSPGRLRSQEGANPGKATVPEATNALLKSPGKTKGTTEAMVPVSALLELFKGTLERRDAMLAQKLKADDEKEYAGERIASIEARIEERLFKRLKEELGELVQDLVDQELKTMVTPGGSFEKDLMLLVSGVIDEKASGQLVSWIEGIHLGHEHRGGPGRGHRQKRTARFSATMDNDIYTRMKGLQGTFSSHLTAACRLYLRALESKR